MDKLKRFVLPWRRVSQDDTRNTDCEKQRVKIEDYPLGYPRFSALIAAHNSFHLCRRFSSLRARLLLLKQDKLSVLEEKLEQIDKEETAILFLGCNRCDRNDERSSVLSEIDSALADYDAFVERNHRMLGFEAAKPRHVLSLQNWVNGNACLARDETEYLRKATELLSISSVDDGAVNRLAEWMEDILIRFFRGSYKARCDEISRDSNIFILSGTFLIQAARTILGSLIICFLLAPMIICNSLNSVTARMVVVIIATILFIATLAGLTRARTVEMFVTGAAYATVLIVFVSGTNPNPDI